MFNYARLRCKIKEVYRTETRMADAVGISRPTLSLKLNGKAEWGQYEMLRVMRLLNEPLSNLEVYFFNCEGNKKAERV